MYPLQRKLLLIAPNSPLLFIFPALVQEPLCCVPFNGVQSIEVYQVFRFACPLKLDQQLWGMIIARRNASTSVDARPVHSSMPKVVRNER